MSQETKNKEKHRFQNIEMQYHLLINEKRIVFSSMV